MNLGRTSLAYDPPVRASRREYLARTMWLEVLKGLALDEVIRYGPGSGKLPSLPSSKPLDLMPAKTTLQWSTLQVRTKHWTCAPRLLIGGDGPDPILHILVGCQSRFAHGEATSQAYSIGVRRWHSGEHVDLYQEIQARVRVHVPVTTPGIHRPAPIGQASVSAAHGRTLDSSRLGGGAHLAEK